jgi:transcription antitermination factor NusB
VSKNLSKYKKELKTRECLVQAIYQFIFQSTPSHFLIEQFLNENSSKNINYEYFKERLEHIYAQSDSLKKITRNAKNLKEESIEMIDEAIIWLGIVEIKADNLPQAVVMDECIRLAKKFSNPNSFKFINAKLDGWLKENA